MKTISAKDSEVTRKWYVVDCEGKTLGRLATEIATVLRGKHKPTFTPHVDTGDFVVCLNSEKIVLKGKKALTKKYYKHTGHFGGIKEVSFADMIEKTPEKVITSAVKGMLPKNKLAAQVIKKLKVYKGSEHPHEAQQPEFLDIQTI